MCGQPRAGSTPANGNFNKKNTSLWVFFCAGSTSRKTRHLVLEGTGCETIEQLQYINSRGMGATNIDEYRNYIKNFHFLPLLGI